MWFGKAVEDFNRDISEEGSNAPQLIAATSNGFISQYLTGFSALTEKLTVSQWSG